MDARRTFPWDLLPLAGALAIAGLLAYQWPHLPARLATHFDGAGRPNGWTPKAALPLVTLAVPLLLWGLLALIGAAQSRTRPALKGLLAPFRALLVLGVQGLFADLLLHADRAQLPTAGLLAFGACLLLGTALLVARARRAMQALPPDPRYVGGGLFFHDAADPRLWVPKRLGLGWTLNFARPLAWLVMLLLLALPVAVALFGLTR